MHAFHSHYHGGCSVHTHQSSSLCRLPWLTSQDLWGQACLSQPPPQQRLTTQLPQSGLRGVEEARQSLYPAHLWPMLPCTGGSADTGICMPVLPQACMPCMKSLAVPCQEHCLMQSVTVLVAAACCISGCCHGWCTEHDVATKLQIPCL